MKTKIGEKVFFGTRKEDKVRINLDAVQWSCGWYWGFGYLGNIREHYHLSSYQTKDHHFKLEDGSYKFITEKRNINMRDALLEDYNLNPLLLEGKDEFSNNLWVFCELVLTAYDLKSAAEMLGRGGSHMTTNPCADIIKNQDEVKRINEIVLPVVFEEIYKLFQKETT